MTTCTVCDCRCTSGAIDAAEGRHGEIPSGPPAAENDPSNEMDSPSDPTALSRQASASAGRSGGDRPMGEVHDDLRDAVLFRKQGEIHPGTTEAPEEAENHHQTKKQPEVLIEMFGGISAARMALFISEIPVRYHTYCDHHQPAVNVSDRWWPTKLKKVWKIQEVTKSKAAIADFVEEHVKLAKAEKLKIRWTAGFPCREMSSLNVDRRGLEAGETASFYDALEIWKVLKERCVQEEVALESIWENVQSAPESEKRKVTRALRAVDSSVELLGLTVRTTVWRRGFDHIGSIFL